MLLQYPAVSDFEAVWALNTQLTISNSELTYQELDIRDWLGTKTLTFNLQLRANFTQIPSNRPAGFLRLAWLGIRRVRR